METQRHYVVLLSRLFFLLFALELEVTTAGQPPPFLPVFRERAEQSEGVRYAAASARIETISLGLVATKPERRIEEHQDFVNYLARKLSSGVDVKRSVIVAPAPLQLAKLLIEKKVDFYMDSPYPTYLINTHAGSRLLLRRWKGGVSEYRGVLFTKRHGGIARLDDLLGKTIVFEDPASTSGYFLPKTHLLKKGFNVTQKSSFQEAVSPNEIGYVFAGGSEKIVLNLVLSRKVAAGAVSDNDLETVDEKKKLEILVLAETEMFPRHLVSVQKELTPLFENQLKETLLSMHRDPEGQRVLKRMDNTTQFDLLPGGEEMVRRKFREVFRTRSMG